MEVFENVNDSEWEDPYFVQPKPKTNQVYFLSGFRKINDQFNCKPYSIHKIN